MHRIKTQLRRLLFEGEVMRLMGMTMLVKPVGLVTQVLIARYFGAGVEYDAYAFAVFLISFFDTAIGATYNAIIVPVTIKLRSQFDERTLQRYQNAVLMLFLTPVVVYMLVLMARSEWIVGLFGANLPEGTRAEVDRLVRWMALPGIAMIATTMGKAVLNLNRRYRLAGAMPLFNAVFTMLAVVLLHKPLGIWCLPVGFMVANVGQFLIVGGFNFVTRCIVPVRPAMPPGAGTQLWSLGWPLLVSQVMVTLNASIDKLFASGLEVGSISAITYASTILNMGLQLFSMSIMVIMFTRMSEMIAAGDMRACSAYIQDNLHRVSRLVVPASLALCLASGEIVRILFQRGAFDASDATRTSGALAVYMLGLPALVINWAVARIYHTLQKMRERIWLTAQYLATSALGNLLLVNSLKVTGLAISASLAINLHLLLSLWLLGRFRTGLDVGSFTRVVFKAYALAVVAYLVYTLSGFGRLMDGWEIRSTLVGAFEVAACRTAFVIGVYALAYLAWRRYERRPRPPVAPATA